ncbi:sister chromatid cohesion protein Dcc1 [Kockovaella imperatae]|uniref:Sister chromatid cohesion protein Dcc1 n=1 Tax=Kockovaella imperatae TaxID=4999 RepID=A0A1Y1UIC6_9TREE|nr:sister chromatid cohesion protein Dcc1 [Kockovaella imperatae]ORX37246.1 sister chromatid cohesion protein Dcc1 [Kockovaella imperatae]
MLPESNVVLRLPRVECEERYQLLELPLEIVKKVKGNYNLTIRGKPTDDAVLCTPDATFGLRSVLVSNSLLVCRDAGGSRSTLEIRDTSHQVIECVPRAPDLERIRTLLKPSQWEGMDSKKRKRDMWTRDQLGSVIQASEKELEMGLKERNVVEYQGRMMMLPSRHLVPLLNILLTLLVVHGKNSVCPIKPILSTLSDHDLTEDFVLVVLDLFGEVDDGTWTCNLEQVIREIGLGLLARLSGPVPSETFESDWHEQVGDTWAHLATLDLLKGNHLTQTDLRNTTITSFPVHELSLDPATRFSDLFLTRPKWLAEEMKPFLRGLVRDGDDKARDKLVGKYVRVVKTAAERGEATEVWWYPRKM